MSQSLIGYPEVAEEQATGRTAAVYAQIRRRHPIVPALFRSLAVCPEYLCLAWDQADGAMGAAGFEDAAQSLAQSVADLVQPPPDPARSLLGRFASGRMLLLSAGLLAAADDELSGDPARPGDLPPPQRPELSTVLEVPATDVPVLDEIRAELGTPIVNSLWLLAARAGVLDQAWKTLHPQVGAAREVSARLQEDARLAARTVPWVRIASPQALQLAGVTETLPAVRVILDAYWRTLALVLPLVASSARS